jgi:hypothetical protein
VVLADRYWFEGLREGGRIAQCQYDDRFVDPAADVGDDAGRTRVVAKHNGAQGYSPIPPSVTAPQCPLDDAGSTDVSSVRPVMVKMRIRNG